MNGRQYDGSAATVLGSQPTLQRSLVPLSLRRHAAFGGLTGPLLERLRAIQHVELGMISGPDLGRGAGPVSWGGWGGGALIAIL